MSYGIFCYFFCHNFECIYFTLLAAGKTHRTLILHNICVGSSWSRVATAPSYLLHFVLAGIQTVLVQSRSCFSPARVRNGHYWSPDWHLPWRSGNFVRQQLVWQIVDTVLYCGQHPR